MTVSVKPKTELTVPESIRRKAGLRPGDRVEFRVSGRAITTLPKLTPDELEDELEWQDAGARRAIRESNADIAAGRVKPAEVLLSSSAKKRAKAKR